MRDTKYFEVKIRCTKEVAETVCTFLLENGALGALEASDFDTGRKKRKRVNTISGYFKSEKDFIKIKGALKRFLNELKKNFAGFNEYRMWPRSLKERNWREEYKKFFKPTRVSKRIVVRPDYEDYKKRAGEHVIVINPQMAFGIGSHPTTKMCIKYIDEMLINHDDPQVLSLLDAGSGSGIISIAAALLGLNRIYGFDIDPVAHETALGNVRKNGVLKSVKLGCHGIERISGRYDIVVANILAHVLIENKKRLVRAVKKGGTLILSGILKTQKDDLFGAFTQAGELTLISTKREKEWVTLLLRKQ